MTPAIEKLLKISVQSSAVIHKADEPTKVRIQCTMTDGSIWHCALDGSDWQQSLFSFETLTEKFHEQLKAEAIEEEKLTATEA